MPNVKTFVVDKDLNPVGIGVRGELVVAGVGLARGYVNLPNETSERFRNDLSCHPNARVYLTGDLVHWRRDGQLVYHGRISQDSQTKVRGHRIELEEVRSLILSVPCEPPVVDAFVTIKKIGNVDVLMAYVLPANADTLVLSDHLAAWLPSALMPMIYPIDHFPHNNSGKVEKDQLPLPPQLARAASRIPGDGSELSMPESTILQIILDAYRKVLGLRYVSPSDSFIELSGDSIMLLQLAKILRDRLESETAATVNVPLLLQFSTPMALNAQLERLNKKPIADIDDVKGSAKSNKETSGNCALQ